MPLTDYVIMPGADYQAICEAVRTKNGTTDVLKSGEIAEIINGWDVSLVKYVTITLSGTGKSRCTAATIDGASYYTGQSETLEVPVGTVISLSVDWTDEELKDEPYIYLYKGGVYDSALVSGVGSCEYTVVGNTTITFGYDSDMVYTSTEYSGYIIVYEE